MAIKLVKIGSTYYLGPNGKAFFVPEATVDFSYVGSFSSLDVVMAEPGDQPLPSDVHNDLLFLMDSGYGRVDYSGNYCSATLGIATVHDDDSINVMVMDSNGNLLYPWLVVVDDNGDVHQIHTVTSGDYEYVYSGDTSHSQAIYVLTSASDPYNQFETEFQYIDTENELLADYANNILAVIYYNNGEWQVDTNDNFVC